jgi:hypothetical protein
MTLESKIKKHEETIYYAAFLSGGAGMAGALMPALDIGGVSGAWVTMIILIGQDSNRQLDKDTVVKLVTGILAGAAAYLGGSKIFTFALNAIPGIGTLGAVGINAILNFLYTMRLGRYIALQMEKPEFDTGDWAGLIPEITAIVFAMPSVLEIREAWKDWTEHQQYKR